MYIGSAGPGPGGRTDGRTGGGRAGGRRADGGRTGGGADFERQYNDFHRFSQKASKNTVFFCRFASGGSASTDFYRSNEKGVQKTSKKNTIFFDFSNQANAQVPIFTVQNSIFEHLRQSGGSPGNGARSAAPNPPTTRRGSG